VKNKKIKLLKRTFNLFTLFASMFGACGCVLAGQEKKN